MMIQRHVNDVILDHHIDVAITNMSVDISLIKRVRFYFAADLGIIVNNVKDKERYGN